MRDAAHPSKRIPSLDGIRALAIGTVIICHLAQHFAPPNAPLPPIDGVEFFFVLSGFLITTLMLRERELTGSLDLPSFYQRRALRILPPLLGYLAVVAIACHLTRTTVPWPSMLGAAFFVSDIYNQSIFTEHLWSLAIEEQFYLAWPLLMLWAIRHGGRRFAAKLTLVLILASPVFRVATSVVHTGWLAHRQSSFLFGRMDSLFAGCLVALWLNTDHMERFFHKTRRWWWLTAVFFLAVSPLLRLLLGNLYIFTVGYTFESLAMAYFVIWAARSSTHPVGRFLNWKPMVFIGWLSYSLYLYQSAPIHTWPGFPTRLGPVSVLAIIFALALFSYYVIEKPALRFKVRRVKAPAAQDASTA